ESVSHEVFSLGSASQDNHFLYEHAIHGILREMRTAYSVADGSDQHSYGFAQRRFGCDDFHIGNGEGREAGGCNRLGNDLINTALFLWKHGVEFGTGYH